MSKILPGLALTFLLLFPIQASSFKSLFFHHSLRLSDEIVEYLSKIALEPEGARKIGKYIAQKKLTNEGIEDAFIRIAVRNNVISQDEAMGMFSNLSGVKGFSSTLRKIIGNKHNKAQGHLNELRIAHSASQRGFSVMKIGEKFRDGIKKGVTDIDVVLEKNNTVFALEAKDYAAKTQLPMDQFRADIDTLRQYKKEISKEKFISVLSLTNKPDNLEDLKRLQSAAGSDVRIIIGSPDEQAEILSFLARVS
ncbi:MAG: hypothetical protein OXE76_00820 [Alphaproteobacteria bacterium]|nr:hypothetical protein [Alphaproteobacteria bacterium]